MSGLWGYQTALDLYLKENGIRTLFFAGVNTDQVRFLPLCYAVRLVVKIISLKRTGSEAM